jgi:hypothetical protein
LGFGEGGLFGAEGFDLAFEVVALGAGLLGHGGFGGAQDEVELVGAEAVGGCAVFGGGGLRRAQSSGGADALEEGGWGAAGVAVVVEEGVLGGEAALFFVEGFDLVGGGEVGFEEGGLAVLVEVGGGVGDVVGEVDAEARILQLVTALGGGDDDAVGAGKAVEEGGAGGGAVEEGEGAFAGLEPLGEFGVGDVGAAEVELGLLAVEGAVADEDQPEG